MSYWDCDDMLSAGWLFLALEERARKSREAVDSYALAAMGFSL